VRREGGGYSREHGNAVDDRVELTSPEIRVNETERNWEQGIVNMRRFFLLFEIVAFLCIGTGVNAQSNEDKRHQCRIHELLNSDGWEIPGASEIVVKLHARYSAEGTPPNVFVDVIESHKPQAVFTYVGLESCDSARLVRKSIDVEKIERFAVKGRVFGYLVTGVLAGNDTKGHRIHFGSEERAYYYDPDGSGKFTRMRYDTGDLIFKIVVPDWVER